MPWRRQPSLQGAGEVGFREQVDLVHDRAGDRDAGPLEQRLVEDDLVDRTSDTTLGHDHGRRSEHRRDLGVRQPDDRPDARVASPFDEQHVALGDEGGVGRQDAARKVLDHLAIDVALGEASRDVDRAHLLERLGKVEDALHEDGVLIGRNAILDHGALADRLDEPGRQSPPQEPVHDPEAERGLAAVLAGRGEVYVAQGRYPCVPVLRSTRPSASRSRATVSASTASGSRYGPSRSRMSVTSPKKTLASATKNCGSLL